MIKHETPSPEALMSRNNSQEYIFSSKPRSQQQRAILGDLRFSTAGKTFLMKKRTALEGEQGVAVQVCQQ